MIGHMAGPVKAFNGGQYQYVSSPDNRAILDISRTLIINYRWPAAIGLVPLWQPAKYV